VIIVRVPTHETALLAVPGYANPVRADGMELSGNIKRRVSSESLAVQEACMIGFTSFSDDVARLLRHQEKEELNTFGIGE